MSLDAAARGKRVIPWQLLPVFGAVLGYYLVHSNQLQRRVAAQSAQASERLRGITLQWGFLSPEGIVVSLPPRSGSVIVLVGSPRCRPCRALHGSLLRELSRDLEAARSIELWLVATEGSWKRDHALSEAIVVRSLRVTAPDQIITQVGTTRIPVLLVVDSLGHLLAAQVGHAKSLPKGWLGMVLGHGAKT